MTRISLSTMFSSRNIHFAILGIILGASTGYVYAFYNAQKTQSAAPPLSESQAQDGQVPSGHPGVNNDQMLEAMRKAVETDPNSPDVVGRYALALFESGRVDEAEKWFAKAVELAPNSTDARSMYGLALWQLGKADAAIVQLEATLKLDPAHIPGLHGLVRVTLEKGDFARAEQLIKKIESVEPTYSQLADLKRRLDAARGAK
jgi:tetratricopeptide (TPR) repeat protein